MKVKIITASAGSGKTYRLSEILDDALTSGRARPDCVLATTFTKEAASQLSERARARLLSSNNAAGAQALLGARIGTVNAVCGSLVTDFAFELGLSPNLGVLDEDAAKVELARALASTVSETESRKIETLRRKFATDLDWQTEVKNIISAARANRLDGEALLQCGERSVEELHRVLGPSGDGDAIDSALGNAVSRALAGIDIQHDATKATAKYLGVLREAQTALARQRMSWGLWCKLGKEKSAKKSIDFCADVQEAALQHIAHPRLREETAEFIRLIFQVAARGMGVYQEHKRQMGVLDFVDQESFTLELLDMPEVQEELRAQIDLVLVDEFQDTSPLQLSLFLKLAVLADESVWVGDSKQAIYGFRGTDPKLMDAAIESLISPTQDPDLVRRASDALQEANTETLSTSYRSRPDLVHTTSAVFAPAFARVGLPENRTRLKPRLKDEIDGLPSAYECWHLGGKNKNDYAASLAAGIKARLQIPPQVRDKKTDALRTAKPSDFAILCRTNDECQKVADALASLGLTAVLPSMGVFDTAEGQLLYAGLCLWVDDRDTVARATVARILHHPDDLSKLITRCMDAELPLSDLAELNALLEIRDDAKDLGLLAVLDAIGRAFSVAVHCASWGKAKQRLANLDAIRAHASRYIARSHSAEGAPTVVGFLTFIADLLDDFGWQNSRQDKQALVGGQEAITVSTWHRSKGLEWPITLLFGLDKVGTPASYGVYVEPGEEDFDAAAPLKGRWIRYWPNVYTNKVAKGPVREALEATDSYQHICERGKQELLRVLYVAWTRARDQLIFAAVPKSWTNGIVATLEPGGTLFELPDMGHTLLNWGETSAPVFSQEVNAEESGPRTPIAGSFYQRGLVQTRIPANRSPSSAAPLAAKLGEVVRLGDKIVIGGVEETSEMGTAIHNYFAFDRAETTIEARHDVAERLVQEHGLADAIPAKALMEPSERLNVWLNERFPDARRYYEWPLSFHTAEGTKVSGIADLLLETEAGFVVIDHKSFPGSDAEKKALKFSGQLATYAQAVEAATGKTVLSTWIHFPLLGVVSQVEIDVASLVDSGPSSSDFAK